MVDPSTDEEIKAAYYRFDGRAYRREYRGPRDNMPRAVLASIGMALLAACIIAGLFWRLG